MKIMQTKGKEFQFTYMVKIPSLVKEKSRNGIEFTQYVAKKNRK